MSRFSSDEAMAVYEFSLNGFGETYGNTDMGSHTFVELPDTREGMEEFVEDDDIIYQLLRYRAVIIWENTQGFVSANFYPNIQDARDDWRVIQERWIQDED